MAVAKSNITIDPDVKWPLPLRYKFWSILLLFSISSLLVILGFMVRGHNESIATASVDYTNVAGCEVQNPPNECTVTMKVPQTLKAPIFIYYKLTNFYQNHRSWIMDVSYLQLNGEDTGDTSNCIRFKTGFNGSTLVPCGLQGWSFFNDEIRLADNTPIFTDGIAIKPDKSRFKRVPLEAGQTRTTQTKTINDIPRYGFTIPDFDDERLMVWMRQAATPTFHKTYGRIEQDIPAQDALTFNIVSKFDAAPFKGTKSIVLSTVGSLGGKHERLEAFLLGFGFAGLGYLLIMIATHFVLTMKYN